MRRAIGLPSVRPWRMPEVTSARSDSIFMRPPRPCPSWRRARSRSRSSGESSSPAGRPSTTAVRPGPWDSPAVVKRSAIGPQPYWRGWALLAVLCGDCRQREQLRQDRLAGVADGGAAGVLAELRARVAVGRVALSLVRRDVLAVQLQELELVDGAAVERGELLLVLLVAHAELHEAAVVLVVALALAGRREGGVGDEEDRALGVVADAHEDHRGDLLVGQQGEVRDALERLQVAGLAEADVGGVAEPLHRSGGRGGRVAVGRARRRDRPRRVRRRARARAASR